MKKRSHPSHRALEINSNYANAYYNKACCYGLQNNVELAIENLQRAINLDVKYQDMAKTNKDFEQIRGDERFQCIAKSSKMNNIFEYV
jgi:tetratricopeptide (TPR) repeat protein